jgi:hypothetical protein
MKSQNSSANAQKNVPAEYIPPMSLHRFCEITGFYPKLRHGVAKNGNETATQPSAITSQVFLGAT